MSSGLFEAGVVDEGEHVFGVVPGPMGAGTNAFGQASSAHVEDVDVAGDRGEALCSESDAARRGRDPRDDDERAPSSPLVTGRVEARPAREEEHRPAGGHWARAHRLARGRAD